MFERKLLAAKLSTSEAGLHLASLPEKGDNKCILIATGAIGKHETERYNITDVFDISRNYLP